MVVVQERLGVLLLMLHFRWKNRVRIEARWICNVFLSAVSLQDVGTAPLACCEGLPVVPLSSAATIWYGTTYKKQSYIRP